MGVDEVHVDMTGMLDGIEDGLLGDLMEDDAVGLGFIKTQHLAEMPGDGLSLTVFIGGKPYLLGCTGKALQLLHYFYLVFRNLIVGLKGLLVDAQLLLLQIADVTITRHHFIVTTQELFNGLRLSW